ncbi:hypothetical protein J7K43_01650 [Candidatus Calescamantes bacterium]|nr:hypothetical protein [Candidatus Calescamantes bacterium]
MNFLESFYNLFFHPLFLLRQDRKPFTLSFFVSFLATFSLALYFYNIPPSAYLFFSFFLFFYILFACFISSSIYHFLSESFKGKGNPGNLFNSFLLSLFPFCFLLPFNMLSQSLEFVELQEVIFLPILFWMIFLQIYSIKNNYGLEGGTAVFVYFIPLLAIIVIGVIFLFFSLVLLTLLLGKALPYFLNSTPPLF